MLTSQGFDSDTVSQHTHAIELYMANKKHHTSINYSYPIDHIQLIFIEVPLCLAKFSSLCTRKQNKNSSQCGVFLLKCVGERE